MEIVLSLENTARRPSEMRDGVTVRSWLIRNFPWKTGTCSWMASQIEYFGIRVSDRLEFDSWKALQSELNRLITLHPRRIDVHIRRKLDFDNQADPATWYDTAIGLCKSKLEMRRLNILGHLRAQLREEFCNDIVRRQSIRVLRCEILFANHPT